MFSDEELFEILKASYTAGFRIIHWTGGEPLLRRNFEEIVKYARKLGFIYQKMTTNGVKLKYNIKDLSNSGIDRINISLDTLNPKKFKKFTNSGYFYEVLEGISASLKVYNHIKINVCLTSENFSELSSFIKFSEKNQNKIILKFIELVPCNNIYEMDRDLFFNSFVSINTVKNKVICDFGDIIMVSSLPNSRRKCKYYKIINNGVMFGLNPNHSINYACQKNNCLDFRLNPNGFMSDCSVNIENTIFLTNISFSKKVELISELVSKKQKRIKSYGVNNKHKQRYYDFFRFGIINFEKDCFHII